MKRVNSVVLAGALGLGGAAAGYVVIPAVATAATSDESTADALGDRVTEIREALTGLVDDGTITESQADEVAETLAEELPDRGPGGFGGPGGHGPGSGGIAMGMDTAADVLGITVDELITGLEAGQSLAEIAEEQGVERQTLIDGLVAAAETRLDEAVASGDLTEAEADDRLADLTEHIDELVDRAGLPSPRGPHGPRPDDAPADESGATESYQPI